MKVSHWKGNKRHHARFLVVLMSSQVRLIDPVSSGHSLRKQAAVQACKLNQPLSVWHCGKLQTKTDRPKKQNRKTGHSWVSTESWPDQVLWKDALKNKKNNKKTHLWLLTWQWAGQFRPAPSWLVGSPKASHASRAKWSVAGKLSCITAKKSSSTLEELLTQGTFSRNHLGFYHAYAPLLSEWGL